METIFGCLEQSFLGILNQHLSTINHTKDKTQDVVDIEKKQDSIINSF
jgi:hypothetical protein